VTQLRHRHPKNVVMHQGPLRYNTLPANSG
jgi:hypothetical protein